MYCYRYLSKFSNLLRRFYFSSALDSQADLPFVPGPRECEIINYTPEPKNSLLLMVSLIRCFLSALYPFKAYCSANDESLIFYREGLYRNIISHFFYFSKEQFFLIFFLPFFNWIFGYRSGTGKTTCLVYRMWSRFLAYQEAERRPNMLFMTKSEMLKAEVEKSFQNMGLVLAHKSEKFNSYRSREHEQSNPMFVTSSEWLDVLDAFLPGERFFTKKEAKYRAAFRLGGDLRRTVESLLEQDCELDQDEVNIEEMTYPEFRKSWPKINNSTPKSKIDPALVWLDHFKNLHQNIFKTTKGDPGPPRLSKMKCYQINCLTIIATIKIFLQESLRDNQYDCVMCIIWIHVKYGLPVTD